MLQEIKDSHSSKFASPMACYVYDRLLLEGDNGDDETDNDVGGDWAVRYGRRILWGSQSGFVGLDKFEDVDQARAYMVALKGDWEGES